MHLVRFAALAALVLLSAAPALAAETATSSSGATTTSTSRAPWEWRYEWGDYRDWIRDSRESSSELRTAIVALGTVSSTTLTMPVLFGVAPKDISPNFGDPRSGGRTHQGEDIMAVKGTPVVSPTAAVVLRIGSGELEGISVTTANPGGESYSYIHLDRVAEGLARGKVLKPGDLIGYVGNTGNASGGPAHLHFEVHDANDTPVDPFPRLKAELSLQEKMTYLSAILGQTSDPAALSTLLASNFRTTFSSALAANVAVPPQIVSALAALPAPSTVSTPSGGVRTLPAGDLDLGSTGVQVTALQTYLIRADSGPAAKALAVATATGKFGPMTKAALTEFQAKVGIMPASGYYGPSTRAYVEAHPVGTGTTGTTTPPVVTPPANTPPPVAIDVFSRDLSKGMTGEDVGALQKLLNAKGFTVAVSGAGSPGNETTYFGAATQAAVIKFQKARSITPAVGYVGPITRKALAV